MTTELAGTWPEIKDTTLMIRKGRMSILVRLFMHHPLLKLISHLRFQRALRRLRLLSF